MTRLEQPELRQDLLHLAKEKRVAFALLLCERMFPALEKFARDAAFDSSLYRDGLDSIWKFLNKSEILLNYAQMAGRYQDHAPDTEEFDHPLTSAALNAALSIATTISLLSDDDVNHVVEVAGLARDTAALYAQAAAATPPHSLAFDVIMKHPLVRRELKQQAEELKFVQELPLADSQRLISLLKSRVATTPGLLPPENGR
jgi:uncharacterized protein YjaG (DUF416 family)